MDTEQQVNAIRAILHARGVPTNRMLHEMRGTLMTPEKRLLWLVGVLYTGLAHGNWPAGTVEPP